MIVTLRYFASLREIVGRDQDAIDLPADSSIATARAWLSEHYPAASAILARCVAARNRAFAPDDTSLAAGDEVVFIPPMAGGELAGG